MTVAPLVIISRYHVTFTTNIIMRKVHTRMNLNNDVVNMYIDRIPSVIPIFLVINIV